MARRNEHEIKIDRALASAAGLIETLSEGVVIVDEKGIIIATNKRAQEMFGYESGNLSGDHVEVLISKHRRPEYFAQLDRQALREQGRSTQAIQMDLTGKKADGSEFPISIRLGQMVIENHRFTVNVVHDMTSRREAENRYFQSCAREKSAIRMAPTVILLLSHDHKILEFNPAAEKLFHIRREDVIGHDYVGLFAGEKERKWALAALKRALDGEHMIGFETSIKIVESRERVLKWYVDRVTGSDGRFIGATVIGVDITAHKQDEAKTVDLAKFPAENPCPVFRIAEDGRVLFANHAAKPLLKIWRSDIGQGVSHDWVVLTRSILEKDQIKKDILLSYKGGYFSFSGVPTVESGYVNYYGVDISERKEAQGEIYFTQKSLKRLAHYDPLTGLANRRLLKDRLNKALADARRNKLMLSVLFLDLDGFKNINDAFGHTVGDYVLKTAAQRIKSCLRKADTASRFGGDEFVLLLPGVNKPAEVAILMDRINSKLGGRPVSVEKQKIHLSSGGGISIFPTDGDTAEQLIRNADAALHIAKNEGWGKYHFYTAKIQRDAMNRLELESDLRAALTKKEITVYYQPSVLLENGKIFGGEALVRWISHDRKVILPDKFLSLAEETGLIVPIGNLVLEEACRQMKAWVDAGFSEMKVMVNISARQIHDMDLPDQVSKTLAKTGLEPRKLVIEVTESLVMKSVSEAAVALYELKDMGVEIMLDDFGVGWSYMSAFRTFPIDALKIDRSFIRYVAENSDDAAMVRAIILMAQSLGMRAIAEGVETSEQLDFLRSQNCEGVQGFFFSRPLPADQFTRMLKGNDQRLKVA